MRFGKLTLVAETPDRRRGYVIGLWRCDCGTEKKIAVAAVRAGQHKSCGCLRRKHGAAARNSSRSPEYIAWQAMNARCAAKKGRDFASYGANGITVCDRWKEFENFLADMGRRPSPQHSVDRIDTTRGYSPENCRWATAAQQQRNRRDSLIWHIKGQHFESSREAAAHFGVDAHTIRYWVKTSKDGCHVVPRY